MSHFNEHTLEMAIIELFEHLGYSYVSGETKSEHSLFCFNNDCMLAENIKNKVNE